MVLVAHPLSFGRLWREEDISDAEMYAIKNKTLKDEQLAGLFSHRPVKDLDWYQSLTAAGELAVTGQDQLLISLLSPTRLLEMIRYFTLFDKKAGKMVARYQQVFGIKRLIERINTRNTTGGREGGVIWHTTGFGQVIHYGVFKQGTDPARKSEAMPYCSGDSPGRSGNPAEQNLCLWRRAGWEEDKEAAMATSGKRLAEQIGKGTERIIFSLIQKFNTATKMPGVNTALTLLC